MHFYVDDFPRKPLVFRIYVSFIPGSNAFGDASQKGAPIQLGPVDSL